MSINDPDNDAPSLAKIRRGLETLRSHLIDLDAMAHAAAETADLIPYLPRLPRHPRPDLKPEWTEIQRRNLGRMQSLIGATADAAETVLDEINTLLDLVHPAAQDPDDGGSAPQGPDSGGNGLEGGSSAPARDEGQHGRARSSIILDSRLLPPGLE